MSPAAPARDHSQQGGAGLVVYAPRGAVGQCPGPGGRECGNAGLEREMLHARRRLVCVCCADAARKVARMRVRHSRASPFGAERQRRNADHHYGFNLMQRGLAIASPHSRTVRQLQVFQPAAIVACLIVGKSATASPKPRALPLVDAPNRLRSALFAFCSDWATGPKLACSGKVSASIAFLKLQLKP